MTRAGRRTWARTVLPVAMFLTLSLSGCGGTAEEPDATQPATSPPSSEEPSSSPLVSESATPSLPPDDQRFGSGCKALFSSWRGGPDKRTDDIPAVLALLSLREVSDSYGLLGNNKLARERGVTFFLPVNNAFSLLSFEFMYQLLGETPGSSASSCGTWWSRGAWRRATSSASTRRTPATRSP